MYKKGNDRFLIVFDLDGVLIDSIQVASNAFTVAYQKTVTTESAPPLREYMSYLGWHFVDILDDMGLPRAMYPIFVEESNKHINEVGIFPGVCDMLQALNERGVLMGVATGKDGERARAILKRKCLLHYFGLVIGGDEVKNGKPHPEVVEKQLNFHSIDVGRAMMVGDSPSDIGAGKSAGILTASAMWGDGEADALLAMEPDFVLNSPGQLLNALEATQCVAM